MQTRTTFKVQAILIIRTNSRSKFTFDQLYAAQKKLPCTYLEEESKVPWSQKSMLVHSGEAK